MGGIFIMLSILGIGIGAFLVNAGINGQGMDATLTLIVGGFFMVKEVLDILNSR